MYDYEIDIRLDFTLRESDPEYIEDSDNILSTRWDSIKDLDTAWIEEGFSHFSPSRALKQKNQWWKIDALSKVGDPQLDVGAPLTYANCLRIGSICVDVQIRQQYIDREL